MPLSITWTWTCDICGLSKIDADQGRVRVGDVIYACNMPYGWTYHNGDMICPKHEITIDGQPAPPGSL